jgi:hypothetical protein
MGRRLYHHPGWKAAKPGKGVALRKEPRHFCILLLPGKSMALGSARTAGFDFDSKDSFAP